MGLPVFREPTTTESKPAVKQIPDPSTHARSSIRRQPSVRAARHGRPPAGLRRSPPLQHQPSSSYIPPLPPIPDASSWTSSRIETRTELLQRQRDMMLALQNRARTREHGRRPRSARGVSAIEVLRSGPSTNDDYTLPPPVDPIRPNANIAVAGPDEPLNLNTDPAEYRVVLEPSADNNYTNRYGRRPHSRRGAEIVSSFPPHVQSALDELPPLRRMGHRSINDLDRTTDPDVPRNVPQIDGLGDRRRSWSPESETDQWETLLSTITPDPSLPSADSSFASAAASFPGQTSRNADNAGSRTSSTRPTHLSAFGTTPPQLPSPPSQNDGFDDTQYCDDDGNPIYTTDSDPEATPRQRRQRRNAQIQRRRSRSSARVTFNPTSGENLLTSPELNAGIHSPTLSASEPLSASISVASPRSSSGPEADLEGFIGAAIDAEYDALDNPDHNSEIEVGDRLSSSWTDIDISTRDHMHLHLASLAERSDVPEGWFRSAGLMRLRQRRARRERRRQERIRGRQISPVP